MSALRADGIPTKVTLDELFATEVNQLVAATNEHADELDQHSQQLQGLLQQAAAAGKTLYPLALPQAVLAGQWYVVPGGIWEARQSFSANASPAAGAYWLQIATFAGQADSVAASGISDATAAGRAMLTAASAAAQRKLVSNPNIAANQYGEHPAFTSTDGEGGLYQWLIQSVHAVAGASMVAAPAAPSNGQVNDVAKEFTFTIVPGYPSYLQYKEAGRIGTTAAAFLSAATAYQVGNTVHVTGLASSAKQSLAYYVGGSGNVPDGQPLTNSDAFTGAATPTQPTTSVNQLPVANAGDDLTITQPTSSVALMGAASDADGDMLTYLWRPVAGPSTPLGLPATTLNVVVSNLVPGTYQFGFQATDSKGGKSTEDFVVVTVNAAPTTTPPAGGNYITTDYITSAYIS